MEEKKDPLDLAGELEKLIEKFGEIVEAQEDEIKTLRNENEELLRILRRHDVIFQVLSEEEILKRLPENLTITRAV